MKYENNMCLFWGGELSNWYKSKIKIDGIEFNTNEQYMMYKKALCFNDTKTANEILLEKDPSEQKKLGRRVSNFDASVWSNLSRDVVFRANMIKFSENKTLRNFLINFPVDTIFVEASPYDKIWGIGLGENDPRALDKNQWLGTNWLGEIISDVRNILE